MEGKLSPKGGSFLSRFFNPVNAFYSVLTFKVMRTLRKAKIGARKAKRAFRTLALQIETTAAFVLGGTVITAILLNTNAL